MCTSPPPRESAAQESLEVPGQLSFLHPITSSVQLVAEILNAMGEPNGEAYDLCQDLWEHID